MTVEEGQEAARKIAGRFHNLQCDLCVREIAKKLGKDFPATFEKIYPEDESEGIILVEKNLLISEGRFHLGICLGNLVFDNHHGQGVQQAEWMKKYQALNETPLVKERKSLTEFFGRYFLTRRFRQWSSKK